MGRRTRRSDAPSGTTTCTARDRCAVQPGSRPAQPRCSTGRSTDGTSPDRRRSSSDQFHGQYHPRIRTTRGQCSSHHLCFAIDDHAPSGDRPSDRHRSSAHIFCPGGERGTKRNASLPGYHITWRDLSLSPSQLGPHLAASSCHIAAFTARRIHDRIHRPGGLGFALVRRWLGWPLYPRDYCARFLRHEGHSNSGHRGSRSHEP